MKFISWSVNGLKSAISHGFVEDFKRQDADFFCLQRTRLDKGEEPLQIPNYYQYWNYAERRVILVPPFSLNISQKTLYTE